MLLVDFVFMLLAYPAAWVLLRIRRHGVEIMPRSRRALLRMGLFPLRNHYYEPQFDFRQLTRPVRRLVPLPDAEHHLKAIPLLSISLLSPLSESLRSLSP